MKQYHLKIDIPAISGQLEVYRRSNAGQFYYFPGSIGDEGRNKKPCISSQLDVSPGRFGSLLGLVSLVL